MGKIRSTHIEAIGGKVEIIGSSVYPKEESWTSSCPNCQKLLRVKLSWDNDAFEYDIEVLEAEAK